MTNEELERIVNLRNARKRLSNAFRQLTEDRVPRRPRTTAYKIGNRISDLTDKIFTAVSNSDAIADMAGKLLALRKQTTPQPIEMVPLDTPVQVFAMGRWMWGKYSSVEAAKSLGCTHWMPALPEPEELTDAND